MTKINNTVAPSPRKDQEKMGQVSCTLQTLLKLLPSFVSLCLEDNLVDGILPIEQRCRLLQPSALGLDDKEP